MPYQDTRGDRVSGDFYRPEFGFLGKSGNGAGLVTIQAERTARITAWRRSDRQKGSSPDPARLLQPDLRPELLLCAPCRGELRTADGNHRSEQFL